MQGMIDLVTAAYRFVYVTKGDQVVPWDRRSSSS
jgi:hypothetical protein